MIAALLAPSVGLAAPFVVGDLPDQTTTHCILELDGVWGTDVPVSGTTTKECKFDVASVSSGAHTARAKAVKVDAAWGRQESVPSAPFVFTRPVAPAAPATLRVAP
jgi:hypothetical protein